MSYTLELEDEEVEVVVEALRIQRERWQLAAMGAISGSPLAGVPLERAAELLDRHDKLLHRLPDRGLAF